VEGDKKKAAIVLKNVQISPVRISCKFIPAERFLLRCKDQFDFVFFDPPFPYGFHRRLLESTVERDILKNNGIIMIHRPSELRDFDEPIPGLERIDKRVYGRSIVDFFKKC
jgi:16S rRNA G966 N2-methylase RsmD